MEYKAIQCNVHGGMFKIPVRRGRPPVKCSEDNPCDMVKKSRPTTNTGARKARQDARTRPETPRQASKRTRNVKAAEKATETREALPATKTRPTAGPVTVKHNPSIVLARKAKEQLEPLGWNLKGRQWTDESEDAWAEVTGTRGEETIAIRWVNGKFESQDYSLWNADKTPGQNGMSATALKVRARLPFDPDEMSDTELAKELAGRRVTWWNRIAQNTEDAIIGDKLKIEHTYTGGNETARQIHFVDATPNHGKFRAFNVDALMKVR